MGKHKKTWGRKELISIYNDFVDGTVKLNMLHSDNHYRPFNVTNSHIKHVINNLGYSNYNSYFNAFILKCIKKDKMCLSNSDTDRTIEYLKSFSTDRRYSKEFDSLLNDYFRIRQYPGTQDTMQMIKERSLYKRLYCEDKKPALEEIKCLNECFLLELHTSENLKPLVPSSNSSHSKPLSHSNQMSNSSIAVIVLSISIIFFMISFFLKHANKLLHRNENADRDLPMNQLGNKKTQRSGIKTKSSCLKLANCLKSCEQNYKRGY